MLVPCCADKLRGGECATASPPALGDADDLLPGHVGARICLNEHQGFRILNVLHEYELRGWDCIVIMAIKVDGHCKEIMSNLVSMYHEMISSYRWKLKNQN